MPMLETIYIRCLNGWSLAHVEKPDGKNENMWFTSHDESLQPHNNDVEGDDNRAKNRRVEFSQEKKIDMPVKPRDRYK